MVMAPIRAFSVRTGANTDNRLNGQASIKTKKHPQLWYPRVTAEPIQMLDQVTLNHSRPRASHYERILSQVLGQAGLMVYGQFAVPDMDNRNPFTWHYDLYVEKKPSDTPNGVLIEVDGSSHDTPFQKEQDRRKDYLAKTLGFGPVLRIRNEEVRYFKSVVETVRKALDRRQAQHHVK